VPEAGVFAGRLPDSVNVANTALVWGGRHWSMVMWPLPASRRDREALLAHELWHRIQARLGLPASSPANVHLDTPEGRLWMRLEWHALAVALRSRGGAMRAATADALAFRRQRRALAAAAGAEENALELNEGLAEYTGVRLSRVSARDRTNAALADLSRGETATSYVRSFAYASGPAYGLLLDRATVGWRRRLNAASDLGETLGAALKLRAAALDPDELERRARIYGLDSLRAQEEERQRARQARLAAARQRFVEGPVLLLPLRQPQVSFDPGNLQPLDTLGTVYPSMRVSDTWGVLEVAKGALLASDWTRVTVPAAPDTIGSPLRGDGWSLTLHGGWWLAPGTRPGDQILRLRP
jgi:hypothetical protein